MRRPGVGGEHFLRARGLQADATPNLHAFFPSDALACMRIFVLAILQPQTQSQFRRNRAKGHIRHRAGGYPAKPPRDTRALPFEERSARGGRVGQGTN
jgi:hypothetical protein